MNLEYISLSGWIQLTAYFAVLLLLVEPIGSYMARVLTGKPVFLSPIIYPLERSVYFLCGIDPYEEMTWPQYFKNLLLVALTGFILLFLILVFQEYPTVDLDLAFNISASFITNTDWQSYSPETTLTAQTQMVGLVLQNFFSAAMGISVLTALARGFHGKETGTIGNFWADMSRSILYILLPFAALLAVFLLSQGVVQTFGDMTSFHMLESGQEQLVVTGPVASQVAIKEIGTNGNGYYAATAAHPFENPTPLSNFLEMLAVFLIPASLTLTFGILVKDRRQGWALLAMMVVCLVPLALFATSEEVAGNPLIGNYSVESGAGNMEGKEVRFGATSSAMWTALNGASSSGSASAFFDSLMPLTLLVPLGLIELGQVIFGGCGSGLYGLLVYVIFAVFVANLMIGRAPEYLGKRIGEKEIKYCALVILIPAILTLLGTASALMVEEAREAASHPHAQGFLQILYAVASAANNNGSILGGLNGDVVFFNILLAFLMLISRFFVIGCILALAGSFSEKNIMPPLLARLNTASPMFIFFAIVIMLFLCLPAFLPSMILGPVAEHFHLLTLVSGG